MIVLRRSQTQQPARRLVEARGRAAGRVAHLRALASEKKPPTMTTSTISVPWIT